MEEAHNPFKTGIDGAPQISESMGHWTFATEGNDIGQEEPDRSEQCPHEYQREHRLSLVQDQGIVCRERHREERGAKQLEVCVPAFSGHPYQAEDRGCNRP